MSNTLKAKSGTRRRKAKSVIGKSDDMIIRFMHHSDSRQVVYEYCQDVYYTLRSWLRVQLPSIDGGSAGDAMQEERFLRK